MRKRSSQYGTQTKFKVTFTASQNKAILTQSIVCICHHSANIIASKQ